MSYAFRLSFRALGPPLDADAELTLPTGAVIRAANGSSLRDAVGRLVLSRVGYATEVDARTDGEHHRFALYLAGPASGYPVDARDAPGSTSSRMVKDVMRAHGCRLLDNPYGLQVFQVDPANAWLSMSATGTVHLPPIRLRDGFGDAYARISNRVMSEKEQTALELFNLAHVDTSLRAQFMTFVTVVEVLSAPRLRSQNAQDFVEQCIRGLAASSLTEQEQGGLRAALGNLRERVDQHRLPVLGRDAPRCKGGPRVPRPVCGPWSHHPWRLA